MPHADQHQGRHQQGQQLDPILDGLGERDRTHAARGHRGQHHDHHEKASEPARRTGLRRQRQPGPLQLWHQIEPADDDHQHARDPAHDHRLEPDLREVGQRVGAAASQRRRHHGEQDQVAGGVADRVPERVVAVGQDQPGDAQERGSGKVFAADRGRVPARRHGPRGDVEVAGRARPAQAERAHDHGQNADQDDRCRGHRRVVTSRKASSLRSDWRTATQASAISSG
jgi:hypothetical protein